MQSGTPTDPLTTGITVLFGITTAILTIVSIFIAKRKSDQEHTLIKFKEYLQELKLIEPKYIDVIFLGPRKSGKTSIVELWTSPWTQIDKIESSDCWNVYEKDVHEFREEKKINPRINIEQIHRATLRLKVHDYPGEDEYKVVAAENINNLGKKVVLVLILDVGFVEGQIVKHDKNADYYSYLFVETIRNRINNLSSKVAKIIIVFNKCDELPQGWSENQTFKYLLDKNKDSLDNILKLFSGKHEYCLTSALTNKGLLTLLGQVGLVGIESPKEQAKFKSTLKKFEEELSK